MSSTKELRRDPIREMFGALTSNDAGVAACLELLRQRSRDLDATLASSPKVLTSAERDWYAGQKAALEDLGSEIQALTRRMPG
jgi:hypothetical protein